MMEFYLILDKPLIKIVGIFINTTHTHTHTHTHLNIMLTHEYKSERFSFNSGAVLVITAVQSA